MAGAAHDLRDQALMAAPKTCGGAAVDTGPADAAKTPAQHRIFHRPTATLAGARPYIGQGDYGMAEYNQATYDVVADIIAEVSSIDRATIAPESHAINDLGIDSLDFLDVTFAIDKKFGIKMPVEKWMEDVNEGRAKAE
jgi:acyl carrier protein